MTDLSLDQLTPVLDEAESIYIAIRTSSGPHVTPELFTASGDRILCLTSVATMKARRAQHGATVGIGATSPSASLAAIGTMEVLDPASLKSALDAPSVASKAPLGVARFLRDNASEMVGAAFDAAVGRLGRPLPPRRVILAIKPTAATIIEAGEVRLAEGWGGIGPADQADPSDGEPTSIDLGELPGELADLATSGPAALGWLRTDGVPLALPVEWDADRLEATVPLAVFDACAAAASGPACMTFDGWSGYGPSGKQGVILRGTGAAVREEGTARIALQIDRASYWDGIDTGTVDVADS